MDLDSMKYAELRSIAKELGLKANMKADKLLKAIKQHYQEETNKEEDGQGQERDVNAVQDDENATQDNTQGNNEASCQEAVSSPAVFVNTRRGKRNGTKRKISDPESVTECDAKLPPSAAEGDAEAATASLGAKKRKVSSHQSGAEAAGAGQQPDVKDEAPVAGDAEKAPNVAKAGKIPRYQGLNLKNKALKPVTPNFKKLHEAHFNKMESIDSYIQRKTKQMETYRSSVKELKNLSDKTKLQQADGKPQAKANRASMFSPVPVDKRAAEDKRRHTLLSASKAPPNKPAGKEVVPFRPSVLSTRRINVRFSEATHDNEYKRSTVKTPARMSPCVTSSTPQKEIANGGKSNSVKTPSLFVTKGPFIFTGNTSMSATPGTQKKSTFDLKASLSRPLSYKPHTGKLKPFGETKENTSEKKPLSAVGSHQKNYKQHQVQTRGHRRAKHMEDRKQKKESLLGARRGLVMM
ncbi:nucleolar and spindle-associated protein 1 [Chaetodon auriga]|uniref:nucleolar and spindle-associated protein 1 n=1 Tax=Chaetodon auriga TaxID=39042 RepID=UPI004032F0E5